MGSKKIQIKPTEDERNRQVTFLKRKYGLMKKAYELSTLTGTQVLLLVASETGHVYTFATPKLQPLITKAEGKNLIQSCLNAPDIAPQAGHVPRITQGYSDPTLMYPTADLRDQPLESVYEEEKKEPKGFPPLGLDVNVNFSNSGSYPPPSLMNSMYSMPSMGSMGMTRPMPQYMANQYTTPPHSQYQNTANGGQAQYAQTASQYSNSSYIPGIPSWGPPPSKGSSQLLQMPNQNSTVQQQQGQSIPSMMSNKQDHSSDHN